MCRLRHYGLLPMFFYTYFIIALSGLQLLGQGSADGMVVAYAVLDAHLLRAVSASGVVSNPLTGFIL